MNCIQAEDLQLAVKYVLGELPPVQRDEYEDHYIDCPECAKDVYAAAAFTDTAREVFRQEAREAAVPAIERVQSPWFAWLRPVVVVPAFAVLLVALGYQSLVSVPHWKAQAKQATTSRVLPTFSLIAANTRGPEGSVFQVRQGESFGLLVDVPVDSAFRSYVLKLEDPSGNSMILRTLSYEEAQKTVVVQVNPDGHPGAYRLVIVGLSGTEGDPNKGTILATMKFSVEFKQ